MHPFVRPEIPERYSSLVSAKHQNELAEINKRKFSIASQISINSTFGEFLRAKEAGVVIDLEYVSALRTGLEEAYHNGAMDKAAYKEAVSDLEGGKRAKQEELIVHKRQKKILAEDLQDQLPSDNNLETAYANVLVNKVMSATAEREKSGFPQDKFRKAVDEYYNATKLISEEKMGWCHVTGQWRKHKQIKAAHLAPKSLDSDDLSYLFGVGDAVLMDPTNGITLESTVELGLDTGLVVFVPVKKGSDICFILVLTDKNKGNQMVIYPPLMHWKDLDGQELKFLGPQRPAKRFLYFRFVISYLNAKKAGDMPWVMEVEAKGNMWVTPGPYLRRSMLVSLARQVSGHYLPEAFLEGTTFTDAEGSPARSAEEEEIAAITLAVRIDYEIDNVAKRTKDAENDDGDEDEDDKEGNED